MSKKRTAGRSAHSQIAVETAKKAAYALRTSVYELQDGEELKMTLPKLRFILAVSLSAVGDGPTALHDTNLLRGAISAVDSMIKAKSLWKSINAVSIELGLKTAIAVFDRTPEAVIARSFMPRR